MLHNIFKISLFVSLPFILGVAARAWWEIKLFLAFILGSLFFWLFLHSVMLGGEVSIEQNTQNVITSTAIFSALGFMTGPPILKYFGAQFERFLLSDMFDPMYRHYAKRFKTAYANDDQDAFHDFFRAHHAKTAGPGESSGKSSGTSYERYSQSRRAQSRREGAPPQDYRSDKDKMFDALEISDRNMSAKKIKSAYRKLAWKYHPDVLAKNELSDAELDEAQTRMQEINHAYDWLKESGYAE